MKRKKTVVLLGGSFDPIHNGHLAMAEALEMHYHPDEVWFLPTPSPRWKSTQTAFTKRHELVKIAIADRRKWKAPLVEWNIRKKDAPTYTIDTLRYLTKENPNFHFILAIGSDQFERFDEWKEPDTIIQLATLAVIDRPGHALPAHLDKRFTPERVVMVPSETSSAAIRAGLSQDLPHLVRQEVIRQGLYFDQQIKARLSDARYQHSVRVARLAVKYAKAHHLDTDQAYVAAIVHDVSRELPLSQMMADLTAWGIDYSNLAEPMIHAYHGAAVAERELGINDEEILTSIRAHTFGLPVMTNLSMIIYCADKTEPGRGEFTRTLQEQVSDNLTLGTIQVMKDDIVYWQQQAHISSDHPLKRHLDQLIRSQND